MLELILELDKQAFLWFNGLHVDWLDTPMFWLSETWSSLPIYILLIVFLIKFFKKLTLLSLLFVAFLIICSDQTTSGFMKPYFERLRPSHEATIEDKVHLVEDFDGNIYKGGQYGFASSHAANTFAVAMFFYLIFRRKYRYFYLIFLWALLISYTRIYLGVHYPLDILVGGGIGIFFAYILYQLQSFILKRYFYLPE